MSRSRSSIASDENGRLEPRLLRAAENDDPEALKWILEAARANGQMSDNFLKKGLMRSAERGKLLSTKYLLNQGAKVDVVSGNRLSPLLRAVERNNVQVVRLLLDHGVSPEASDKNGRTALMTAAWMNHYHILELLISKGANVNSKDSKKRNVLHNLAADTQCDWGDDVVDLLLRTECCIDGDDAHDELGRTPLHWACATGKKYMAEQLLTRPKGPKGGLKANINAVEIRSKTPLHIAAAHDREDLAALLLFHKANVNARSDGGWTPLHNACDKGSLKIVQMLLQVGAEINAKLLNGITPLHLAAQAGHTEIVECLLQRSDIKAKTRDTFGSTPFLRAAQFKRKDIVRLLAPFNHAESLSEDALGACNGFDATIVDFGNYHNENQVKRRTVYELLYGRDPKNHRKPAITALPQNKATSFRWIHLPANNMAWVEALLTKAFIEEGAHDVRGFRELERSFNHQHRGQRAHSLFMRPLCQSTPRAPLITEEEHGDSDAQPGIPAIVVNGASKETKLTDPPGKKPKGGEDKRGRAGGEAFNDPKNNGNNEKKGNKTSGKRNKGGAETPKSGQNRKTSLLGNGEVSRVPGSPSRKDPVSTARCNICTFMPYLHFETCGRRQEMHEAIRRAQELQNAAKRPETAPSRPMLTRARTFDEMLIRAHLASSSTALHVRRTLDQFFYHNIDTQSRDQDQVVYRYQTRGDDPRSHHDAKIFMVDQLWMYVLGKNLVITSFPQRWQQPKNDPLNVLDGIIEDINSKTREPVKSVYDLALIITSRCSGVFDRHRMGDEEYQFLDMFESSIGNATDRETLLFQEFNAASLQASEWLKNHRKLNRFSREPNPKDDEKDGGDESKQPLFVDKLLDIGQETGLLAEVKDIRDELNMIKMVLDPQRHVLSDLEEAIGDIYREEHRSQQELKKRFKEQQKTIEVHMKDLDRMDKQAERIYYSITDLLDLKQKHANAFEARFARDQAAGTARQGKTIMVFTIVTIVFMPLSFIAAVFAINIDEFPRDASGSHSLPMSYVSKYMFGIGFAISIPFIVIALSVDDIGDFLQEVMRRIQRRGKGKHPENTERSLEALRIEQTLSMARSMKTAESVETEWMGSILPVASHGTARTEREENPRMIGRTKTGFRMRLSQDVERGGR